MRAYWLMAKNEWRYAIRSRIVWMLLTVAWALYALAAIGAYKTHRLVAAQQAQAQRLFQAELAEKDRNPHAAAHFGTYLFKPLGLLSLIDPGVGPYAGSMYRVEAHKQAEMNMAAARDVDALTRFGELSIATVSQLLIPLVLIFLAYPAVGREREQGTLHVLQLQGLSIRALFWGKLIGNYGLVLFSALPAFGLILLAGLSGQHTLLRAFLLLCSYGLYFFVFTGLCIGVSYRYRPATALLLLLCIWTAAGIVLPKVSAGLASRLYPLISYYEFSKQLDTDFYQGIGNDGTYEQRRKKLEKAVLAGYAVDSVSQLPINLDGLMMQDAEDYTSRIYHLRTAPVQLQLQKQQRLLEIAACLSPYLAVKQLSAAFAGTDRYQQEQFHRQAAGYRDQFVRTLNMELAKTRHEDGKYTVSRYFLRHLPAFEYHQPGVRRILQEHGLLAGVLLATAVATLLWMERTIRKNA